jgi:hypothetical protein
MIGYNLPSISWFITSEIRFFDCQLILNYYNKIYTN